MQSIKKRKRNDDDDDDDQDNNVCSAVQCYFARSGASPYCNFHRDKVTCTVCRKRLSHDSFDDHTVERPICKTCIRKTNQRGAGIRTAVHGTFVEKDIAVNAADVSSAFSTAHEQIAQHLNDRLDITPIRIYIRAEVDMERETCEGPLNPWLSSHACRPSRHLIRSMMRWLKRSRLSLRQLKSSPHWVQVGC